MKFVWDKIEVSAEAPKGWEEYHAEIMPGNISICGKLFRDTDSAMTWRGVVCDSQGSRYTLGFLSENFEEAARNVEEAMQHTLIRLNHGWISCEDKLPDNPEQEVLVYNYAYCDLARYKNGQWVVDKYDAIADVFKSAMIDGISHWQALPEKPME